jgi:hypothetical protein
VRVARRHLVSGLVVLGLAGSLALTAADSELLNRKPIPWWLVVHLGSRDMCHHVFWAGVVALCVAWLGIAVVLARWAGSDVEPRPRMRWLVAIAALWGLPLMLGPALFSGDMFSYLGQGDLMRLGIDPYQRGPAALVGHHQLNVLHAVSPFWRHTTAPYGPLFVGLMAIVAAIAGSHHMVLAIILTRGLELAGIALLVVFVPRLARRLGADPARALWIAALSPLVLLQAIGAGHNDALMAGLLLAGVCLALERRLLPALVLCALAALIKLPAAAAVPLVVVCALRDGQESPVRVLAKAAAAVIAPLAAVGLITGVDLHWISGKLLSTPGLVHLAITPATALGYTISSLVHPHLGPHAAVLAAKPLEGTLGHIAFMLVAALGVVLLWRVDFARLVPFLALILIASVLFGPAAWPWYLIWGIALVAVLPRGQRSPVVPAVIVLAVLVVRPNGLVRFTIDQSPDLLWFYVIVAIAALAYWRRGPLLGALSERVIRRAGAGLSIGRSGALR